ncbi:hypothetical protein AB4090_05385 [Acidithiobacillus sp. IBUN Pt1247-S3]|uniref:hypothetical protein n=1 Tax=Acidithiobacillus sp. IBUN Pt1247-S3 TaxID=3166642 RepID=UPI0034E533B8
MTILLSRLNDLMPEGTTVIQTAVLAVLFTFAVYVVEVRVTYRLLRLCKLEENDLDFFVTAMFTMMWPGLLLSLALMLGSAHWYEATPFALFMVVPLVVLLIIVVLDRFDDRQAPCARSPGASQASSGRCRETGEENMLELVGHGQPPAMQSGRRVLCCCEKERHIVHYRGLVIRSFRFVWQKKSRRHDLTGR